MVGTEQLEYKTKCQGQPKCVYYIKGFVTDQTQFMYEYLLLGKKEKFLLTLVGKCSNKIRSVSPWNGFLDSSICLRPFHRSTFLRMQPLEIRMPHVFLVHVGKFYSLSSHCGLERRAQNQMSQKYCNNEILLIKFLVILQTHENLNLAQEF